MKLRLLLFASLLITALTTVAQQVPQGMNYQAVARSLSGDVLASQPVTLRINLTSRSGNINTVHYSETHAVTTSKLGLFSLIIGAGKTDKGTFAQVPWSSQDIWMEVSIQEGSKSGFTSISSSKLLAVPYAFHAMTANQLAGNAQARVAAGGPTDGVPSNVWSTFGNTKTDPTTDRMGTMDYVDLIFVTNKIERLRITKDGDISIKTNLNVGNNAVIGNDLTVKQNVFLNTTGGSTTNNGPLTVANGSATKLTGTLGVDGATNLNNTLNVVGNTTVQGLFNSTNTTQSTNTTTGAVTVAGGVGIVKNLNVGGSTTLGGIVNVTDATESTNTTTGALVVAGGVGIGKRINVGGAAHLYNTMLVDGASTLKSTVGVDGAADFNSSLNVDGSTTLNNTLNAFGQVTINKNLGTDQNNYANYPFRVEGSSQGIAVKLSASSPLPGNNFITFFDSNGNAKGRIEGSATISDGLRAAAISLVSDDIDTDNVSTGKDQGVNQSIPGGADAFFTSDYAYGAYSLTLDFVMDIVRFAINLSALAATPLLADVDDSIWSGIDVGVGAIQLGGYIAFNELQRGVAFESGGADYAEWLPKASLREKLLFGEVVGVKAGVVSKSFTDADKFMVVSSAPAIIGGMPDPQKKALYEKIAFMGQVPVKVLGQVHKGDYILPSGKSDGMAIAVHPSLMKALDYRRVVGVAWSESDPKKAFTYINTAVGINANDLASTVDQMQIVINDMQSALQKVNPDYKPVLFATSGKASSNTTQPGYSTGSSMREVMRDGLSQTTPQAGQTPQAELRQALQQVKQSTTAQGVDWAQYPYLTELFNDPSAENAKKVQDHYTKVLARAQNLMAQHQKSTQVTPMTNKP